MQALSLGLRAPYRLKRWVSLLAQAAFRLDFTKGGPLDSRVTFTRASGGTSFRPVGYGPDFYGTDLTIPPETERGAIICVPGKIYCVYCPRADVGWSFGPGWITLSVGLNFLVANGADGRYRNWSTTTPITFTPSCREVILDRPGDPIQLFTAPANVPRIDYDPATGACKGLLIEEQRTNLLSWSTAPSSGVSLNVGAKQADFESVGLYQWTSTINAQARVEIAGGTVPAGKTYVASAFFKKGTSRYFGLGIYDGFDVFAVCDSDTGVVAISGVPAAGASASCGATHLGGGIYRIWMRYTARSEAGSVTSFKFGLPSETTSLSGGSLSGVSTVLMGGCQCEEGSFPTSYIPTTGAAATRSPDLPSVDTLTPWFGGPGEGSVFLQASVISPSRGNGSPSLALAFSHGGYGYDEIATVRQTDLVSTWDGTQEVNASNGAVDVRQGFRFANGWGGATRSMCLSGGSVFTGPNSYNLSAPMFLGAQGNFNGHIRRIAYWPRRLSNLDLQGLTR